ncbi:MAG TPA: alpha/beta hydrolase [Vicinamibacterales bacterium]|nr:alpha/beta hydrolase [Vicinamibacterales bacterium]
MQAGFAPVLNGRLHYETAGSGDAAVFVHGNAGDRRHWDLQFDPFATGFHAVRYDVRGFGRSSPPVEGQPYSHYEDLAALLDHLKVGNVHVVGWSMGCGIAVDFAIAHPQRVRSLVGIGPWVSGYSSAAAQSMLNDMRQVRPAVAAGGRAAGVDAWMSAPFFRNAIVDPRAGERFRAIANDYSFWHFEHRDPQETLRPSAAARLAEIRVPTLLVTGERDIPACVEIADLLVRSAKRARKAVIPGAGHLMHMEKPDDFNRLVLDFVSSVEA